MHWSFEGEYIACIIILILALYSRERVTHVEQQNALYYECLSASFCSIVINIAAIWLMGRPGMAPYWLLYLLNISYFVSMAAVEFLMARYYLLLIHRNSADKRCYYRAEKVSGGLLILYLAVAAFNMRTGIIFTLGADGSYVRGPGNRLIYVLFLIYWLMVLVCFVRQRRYVERSMRQVMKLAPVIALFLGTFQGMYPEMIMSGTVMAVSLLILFISFQSQKIHTDDLTGLFTREVFYDQMEQRRQERQPFKTVIISVHQFKMVNEKYGTRVGDAFLRQIAEYIREASKEATVCRYAGVRFGIIFGGIPQQEFDRYLAAVRERFERVWIYEGYRCRLPVSMAYIDQYYEMEDVGGLSACLDYAIGICKEREGGQCLYFSREMYLAFRRQNQLVELIKRGMEAERFYLDFQPVYNCAKGKFDSCEALLRLKDENGSNVSPAEFIPLAEKRGLINGLSWMVIEMACRFIRDHPDYSGSLSINFSILQFLEADMVPRIIALTQRYGVRPERLKIEITERIIAEDTKRVLAVMNQLTRSGFGFYLDDFGTGYSSLSYVLTLPFECIKLDKSLVDGIGNEKNRILVEAIVRCFHSIGVETITEGVENEGQRRIMAELGTDKIQGYYYSRPLPEKEFLELMRGQERSGCAE